MTVVDVHVHLGQCLFSRGILEDDLLASMDACGIDRAVVIPAKPPEYLFPRVNAEIHRIAMARADRFTAFCRIDPWQRDGATAEARRCLLQVRMAGLFLHPWEECFPVNHPLVDDLVAVAREARVPVMLSGGHVRVSEAEQIADLAGRWPDVTFIATSGGQINVSGVALAGARRLLLEHPNVLMETSGIYRLDFIEDMAAEIGAGRILFGSDSPRYDQPLELRRVQWAHRPQEERDMMMGANALGLLGLGQETARETRKG